MGVGIKAFVALVVECGEAFQFDWSEEGMLVGGVFYKVQVSHMKLCFSRAFWLVAYPTQTHEMLFDAHARAFAAFGGIPRRGIYANMQTAVARVGRGKERPVNTRLQALCDHYLIEPAFCHRRTREAMGLVANNETERPRHL